MQLEQVLKETEYAKMNKEDWIINGRNLKYGGGKFLGDLFTSTVLDNAHEQVADKLKIPVQYYKRMLEFEPALLEYNINTWLSKDNRDFLVRNLDGKARAFLSSKYRCLDNFDLVNMATKEIESRDGEIVQLFVNDTNIYLKAVTPRQVEVAVGDVIQSGIVLSNSEVGRGALTVNPFAYRLVCKNGMISDESLRKVHLGGRKGEGRINWSDETEFIESRLIWSKARDLIKSTFDGEFINEFKLKAGVAVDANIVSPTRVANHVSREFNIDEETMDEILDIYSREKQNNVWSFANAVTNKAKDFNIDNQIRLEKIGNELITYLPPKLKHIDISDGR